MRGRRRQRCTPRGGKIGRLPGKGPSPCRPRLSFRPLFRPAAKCAAPWPLFPDDAPCPAYKSTHAEHPDAGRGGPASVQAHRGHPHTGQPPGKKHRRRRRGTGRAQQHRRAKSTPMRGRRRQRCIPRSGKSGRLPGKRPSPLPPAPLFQAVVSSGGKTRRPPGPSFPAMRCKAVPHAPGRRGACCRAARARFCPIFTIFTPF